LSQAVEKTPFKSWDQNDMNVAVADVRTRHLGVTKDRTLFDVLRRRGRRRVSMKGKLQKKMLLQN
jgi:hypothetical protein